MATELYDRTMKWAESELGADGAELQHVVWDNTPWMVDAYTGPIGGDRDREIRDWLESEIGPESWPIHGRHGEWNRGSATVYGWTWFGFKSEDAMDKFVAAWPEPASGN